MQRTCFQLTDTAYPIQLTQQAKNRFTVQYGLQTKENLTYNQAATELGACIMHAAACVDKLDNRMPGER